MAKKKVSSKQPVFEESLQNLDAIVAKLEGGQLGLADSLEQYEDGVKHLKACYHLLADAERRIELVSNLDATGKPQTKPFEESGDEPLDEKSSARSRRRSVKKGRRASGDIDDGSSLF